MSGAGVPHDRRCVSAPGVGDATADIEIAADAGMPAEELVRVTALDAQAQRAEILADYRRARMKFGLARLELGARLHLIQENGLWEGLAENWGTFLAEENINPHAARQYAAVAKKFVFELDQPRRASPSL
jgi:hypothetical protein